MPRAFHIGLGFLPSSAARQRYQVEVLRVLRPSTGEGGYLFPNYRGEGKPMSENALPYLLGRAGLAGKHVPHGFRSSFSSITNETFPADALAIEVALAHKIPGVAGIYNRSAYLDRRRELLQWWANQITDDLLPPEGLIGLPRR